MHKFVGVLDNPHCFFFYYNYLFYFLRQPYVDYREILSVTLIKKLLLLLLLLLLPLLLLLLLLLLLTGE